jgi:hypothetical protein
VPYGLSAPDRLRIGNVIAKLKSQGRRLAAPVSVRRTPLRSESFELWGDRWAYFVHPYNTTWKNERAVELAVAQEFLNTVSGRGLEFGNVLSHYGLGAADTVVDKYERAPGVLNEDIVDFDPGVRYDFIVSISTLEHVGWDESPREPQKVLRAFDHLRRLLASDGSLLITTPMGVNPSLDKAILGHAWPVLKQATLVRDGPRWRQSPELRSEPYGGRHGWAGSVWIAIVPATA